MQVATGDVSDDRQAHHRQVERGRIEWGTEERGSTSSGAGRQPEERQGVEQQQPSGSPQTEEPETEGNLGAGKQSEDNRLGTAEQARLADDVEFAGFREQHLGDQSLICPDHRQYAAGERMDHAPVERRGRVNTLLEPHAQAVKTPGGSPAEQRLKYCCIEHLPEPPEAGLVLVAGEKTHAVVSGDVLPVTGPDPNKGLRIS